jgi:hypothetical protein
VVGAVLHELAHWLDLGESAEVEANHYARLVTACQAWNAPPTETEEWPPGFLVHGKSFMRLCAHLWYRSNHGGGCMLRPRWLTFGSDYSTLPMLPTSGEVIDALGDELELFEGLKLRLAMRANPPVAFTELWHRTLETVFAAEAA